MKLFKVEFKVPSEHLGDVLSTIHGKVEDLDVALIEEVPYTNNKPRKLKGKRDTSRGNSRTIVLEALFKSPDHTLTLAQAGQLLQRAGYAKDGVYTLKNALIKRGEIQYKDSKMTLVKAK
jgi:hypothetical protein